MTKKIVKQSFEMQEGIEGDKLKYIQESLSELQGIAKSLDLDTLEFLIEMSVLEAKLQIEINNHFASVA